METGDSEDELLETRELVKQQNRKNKKSGGFQSMGLSYAVFKGILRKGYKIPTPIQRKTIPLLMDGKDVVAMARTGSGKTAAFLIPMFEKLKTHDSRSGARALIISPTRELALQTLKFTKELGKFTGLRSAVVLGGDSLEGQFEALHENPDIIIATPGRLLHVLVEMNLKLQLVEYVVFDEADRLFEMGFQEQLCETIQRLPESRQTLLFSATLPKMLVEFARAGLHDPTLIRLDVDTKLSENLKLGFLHCRMDDKLAVLFYLLRNVVKPSEQTLIFVATKHHVEYLQLLLTEAGIPCSYSYSSLDQTARKINVAKFRSKKTMVLVVTDLAARGIDIPMLDNVINLNFPAKPKLFVHRVGRVARAGRLGTAYSLVSSDELPYVQDLFLFLGRQVKFASKKMKGNTDSVIGCVPQSLLDVEDDNLRSWHSKAIELENMKKVVSNAYIHYLKSRPAPSAESVKRMKSFTDRNIAIHPMFAGLMEGMEPERVEFLDAMKNYRPHNTIFEIHSTKMSKAHEVMKNKRKRHENVIESKQKQLAARKSELYCDVDSRADDETVDVQEDVQNTFSAVIAPKKFDSNRPFEAKKRKKLRKVNIKDREHYIEYKSRDFQSEKGLSIEKSFDLAAESAVLDFTAEDAQSNRKMQGQKKWDRKRKRFVSVNGADQSRKKIRTESGNIISASYKTNTYKDWLNRNKVDARQDSDEEATSKQPWKKGRRGQQKFGKSNNFNKSRGKVKGRRELKTKEEIFKARKIKAKQQGFQKYRHEKKSKHRLTKKGQS